MTVTGTKRGPRKGVKAAVKATTEVRTVAIRNIVQDPSFQVRRGTDYATVLQYSNVVAEGRTMPPVKVALVNGALVLVDGWHRIAAHERRGMTEIEAEIVEATISEAQWMAAEANMTHGLPLRGAEIRTAFRALIKARRHLTKSATPNAADAPRTLLSYRDLVQLMQGLVRHTTIRNWMMADFPRIASKMGQTDPFKATRGAARDEEGVFYNSFTAALDTAAANAPAVRDQHRRGAMIEAAERLVAELRKGGQWSLAEF